MAKDLKTITEPCATTKWRHNLSQERLDEMNAKRRARYNALSTDEKREISNRRTKGMTVEERREYNHQRYLKNKEAYKRRSREQYARNKAKEDSIE